MFCVQYTFWHSRLPAGIEWFASSNARALLLVERIRQFHPFYQEEGFQISPVVIDGFSDQTHTHHLISHSDGQDAWDSTQK